MAINGDKKLQLDAMFKGNAYVTLKRACRWLGISKNDLG